MTINAGNLSLSGVTAVSQAEAGTTGRAGSVSVSADDAMSIINSRIATDTSGTGNAGDVTITARNLFIDPTTISSASAGSGGNAGSVTIGADTIKIDASRITSAALGPAAAGAVNINFGNLLALRNNSAITTTAVNGNGGPISINGGQTMWLTNSQILTSVLGLAGNGGNINVNADTLILQTGFIQANTAAANASGGNVTINVNTLIPSASTLFVGGATPIAYQPGVLGLNVIQAAAPDGVSGAIEVTSPQLDLTGSLSNLSAAIVDTSALSRDLCRIGAGSSLTPIGRGGLAPSAIDALRPEAPPRDSQAAIGSPLSESPTDFRPVSQIALGCLRNGEQP